MSKGKEDDLPVFAISIALIDQTNEVLLGIVYEINAAELFYAWKGSKAYLNDKSIHVSAQQNFNHSLVATGFPYHDFEKMPAYLNLLGDFMKQTSGVRRLGSAAVDLVYVACGRFESFYEYNLNPWDVAGGAFIVQQAGGFVSDWKGKNDFIFGREILASNAALHSKNLELIQYHFS